MMKDPKFRFLALTLKYLTKVTSIIMINRFMLNQEA